MHPHPVNLLTEPLRLRCGATLPNRLAKSAMSEALGTADNHATAALALLYGRWADGGLGLSITGNVMVDRRALGEPGNVCVEDDSDLTLLQAWAQSGKRGGGAIWVQLNHPGKQSPKGLNRETVAPSAVPFAPSLQTWFATPRALTAAEIEDIVARFGQAAAVLERAGFDGVQIHGAHGYLVSQFLSPLQNQRDDAWGGDAVRRRRFVLEVYRAIRAATSPRFAVGIKLNSADFQRGGFTAEESIEVMRALDAEGIDLLEISGGTYESPKMAVGLDARDGVTESTRQREAYFLDFAAQARQHVQAQLMVTGGFRTVAAMDAALASGALDVVGLARPMALEPDLPKRLLQGLDAEHPTPRRITTGIAAIDRMALMEVAFYARQLRRMGHGKDPQPRESPLKAALATVVGSGWKGWRSRRLRA
jgi:2,4-dienoyl-CoA reductase-like NADH-dependent reductase (Old Yellow Enzyme family)